jgi:glycosyltransferase involved in cell wall biosynthesis
MGQSKESNTKSSMGRYKNMSNQISIIIPVYKIREDLLRNCFKSVRGQSYKNWEVILVDDGSPDNCGEICDEIANLDDRFKVVHQPNQGESVARNTGLAHSTGNWITFVDPDDWVEPDWMESLYSAIDKTDSDIILYDYWREFKNNSKLECFSHTSQRCEGKSLEELRNGPFFKLIQDGTVNPYAVSGVWNKIYKKSFLEEKKLQFIPGVKRATDRLFNAKALQCTDKISYLHQPFYHYRCSGDTITNRYNPNIVSMTKVELNGLAEIIEQFHLSEKTRDYLTARTCTRIYSCLRLYIFHNNNSKSTGVKFQELHQLIEEEPFKSALKHLSFSLLSRLEKVFVLCLKLHFWWAVKVMVHVKSQKFGQNLQS